MEHAAKNLTRRTFVAGTLATAATLALAGGAFADEVEGEGTEEEDVEAEEEEAPLKTTTAEPTGELAFDMAAWNYDEDNDVWWQVGNLYCTSPQMEAYESMGLYVPGAYLTGEANDDGTYTCARNDEGVVGDFTALTAPIVIPVNTAGYASQAAPTSYSYNSVGTYLEEGLIYAYPGCRGRDNGETDDGSVSYGGGSPWGVADLKAAVRYLRYNSAVLPGDMAAVFTFGHSGGGAQSSLVGATGDSDLYAPYLETIGAAMTDSEGNALSDATAGAMCWCPITCLTQADEGYEWQMGQFASTGTRAEGTFTAQLSLDLAAAYAQQVNALGLTKDDEELTLEESEEGVWLSGTYADVVLAAIEESLNNFLEDTEFPYTPSSSEMADGGFGGGLTGDVDGLPSGDLSDLEGLSELGELGDLSDLGDIEGLDIDGDSSGLPGLSSELGADTTTTSLVAAAYGMDGNGQNNMQGWGGGMNGYGSGMQGWGDLGGNGSGMQGWGSGNNYGSNGSGMQGWNGGMGSDMQGWGNGMNGNGMQGGTGDMGSGMDGYGFGGNGQNDMQGWDAGNGFGDGSSSQGMPGQDSDSNSDSDSDAMPIETPDAESGTDSTETLESPELPDADAQDGSEDATEEEDAASGDADLSELLDSDADADSAADAATDSSSTSSSTYETAADYIEALNADEVWVDYDEETNTAVITGIGAFARQQKSPSKDVCAFDDLSRGQAENGVFGNGEESALHFDRVLADLLAANADTYAELESWDETYPEEYEADLAKVDAVGLTVEERTHLYDPLYYLVESSEGFGTSTPAPHWRIRTGITQGDTAITTELNLALALEANDAVEDVDFAMVWGQGHTTAERTGDSDTNFITWVKECCGIVVEEEEAEDAEGDEDAEEAETEDEGIEADTPDSGVAGTPFGNGPSAENVA